MIFSCVLHQSRAFFSSYSNLLHMLMLELASEDLKEELRWSFQDFHLDNFIWKIHIAIKLIAIICSHMVKDRELIRKVLKEEFSLAINIVPTSKSKKEKFFQSIGLLTTDCLKIFFSTAYTFYPHDFMKLHTRSISIRCSKHG
jgi:hypothetical protein